HTPTAAPLGDRPGPPAIAHQNFLPTSLQTPRRRHHFVPSTPCQAESGPHVLGGHTRYPQATPGLLECRHSHSKAPPCLLIGASYAQHVGNAATGFLVGGYRSSGAYERLESTGELRQTVGYRFLRRHRKHSDTTPRLLFLRGPGMSADENFLLHVARRAGRRRSAEKASYLRHTRHA